MGGGASTEKGKRLAGNVRVEPGGGDRKEDTFFEMPDSPEYYYNERSAVTVTLRRLTLLVRLFR